MKTRLDIALEQVEREMEFSPRKTGDEFFAFEVFDDLGFEER